MCMGWGAQPNAQKRKKLFWPQKVFLKVLVGCSYWFLGGFLLGALLVCRASLY